MKETADIDQSYLKDHNMELLSEVPFFNCYDLDELLIIAKYIDIFSIESGEILFREG